MFQSDLIFLNLSLINVASRSSSSSACNDGPQEIILDDIITGFDSDDGGLGPAALVAIGENLSILHLSRRQACLLQSYIVKRVKLKMFDEPLYMLYIVFPADRIFSES